MNNSTYTNYKPDPQLSKHADAMKEQIKEPSEVVKLYEWFDPESIGAEVFQALLSLSEE